ncbi:Complement component 1 Q subcomponent-binding protein, mitochondrial [Bulinus truncatus]|nr:Complement component 1 Q subcomponent-binding protein, mitochondrial [Bulinus truncatus]
MAKALKVLSASSKLFSNGTQMLNIQKHCGSLLKNYVSKSNNELSFFTLASSRTLSTLSSSRSVFDLQRCTTCSKSTTALYSTEVDREISKFLEKEIEFERKRSTENLPKIPGFDIQTNGGDVTITKISGKEKITVKLSVNGSVDSIMSENHSDKDEPPQMVCRPDFEIEISKGDGTVLAIQCSFPVQDTFEDVECNKGQEAEQIDDQFEITDVAIHDGEWKDTTFTVSASTMDAELFDLMMDMLDERGINDEFITQMVDFCTAYENHQYIGFLQKLKAFAEK